MTMDYKPTLCLPKTDFPMKADLPRREPEIRSHWGNLYAEQRKARAGAEKFTFHDGPPYANGDVHIGTALNKILKDFIVRSRGMTGLDAPFVPGWDCHGLPIEHKVMKEAGSEARTLSPAEIRKRCRMLADHFVKHQKAQYIRLGIVADWERPYLTMDPSYEDGVLSVFQDLVEKGFVTRDKRSTSWCPNDATALAEAELEYRDKESPSIYVRCAVTKPSVALEKASKTAKWSLIVWTTTPWTLPANLAIAVNPDLDYTLFAATDRAGDKGRLYVVATKLVDAVVAACGFRDVDKQGQIRGRDLIGTTYVHPLALMDSPPVTGGRPLKEQPVVAATYVSGDDGTGCVHTAPGHGADDFRTGQAEGLPIFSPVDQYGRYTDEVGPTLKGKRVPTEANEAVLGLLGTALLHQSKITHSYAHCWRCKGPIIFRATDQWFIRMETGDLRKKALEAVAATRWVPEWGSRRIGGMVETRPDWCISRQRHWGIPIPAVVCGGCAKSWTTPGLVKNARAVVAKEGADSWFDGRPAAAFLGNEKCPHCGSAEGALAKDIFDVWFESGTSWRAAVERDPHGRMQYPSDVVIEGTDQHRGWFQLSLLPSVAVNGRAPWKTVVTNGFIVDAAGDKVSKSKGGLLHADELADKFGADVARLWVASVNYHDDVPVSHDLLQKFGENYRKIRNTFRWLLGNLDGYFPARDTVPDGELLEADRWVLARLEAVHAGALEAFEAFDFARALRLVFEFCDQDLSAFWFDFNKDRFYCDAAKSARRRSGQTACLRLADGLCRILAPILVHTTHEVWEQLPGREVGSVHLTKWPAPSSVFRGDAALLARWERLRAVRSEALAACEKLRADKAIGGNAEASVRLGLDGAVYAEFRDARDLLAEVLMVSEVEVAEGKAPVAASRSPHPKCERCWRHRPAVAGAALCARCDGVVKSLPTAGA
jgi:isoleucyl-tRNA synthetase